MLKLNRTVCYRTSSGLIAQARFATVTRKQATYPDRANAPTRASLGDTGLISDADTASANLTDDNLLVWANANQDRRLGVGVRTTWFMEAVNNNGIRTYSDVIHVLAGETGCGS